MARIDQIIMNVGAVNDGVVARADLLGRGVSPKSIARRVQSGALQTRAKGIYLVPSLATERTSLRVATRVVAGSFVSHYSAAALHGMWVPSYYRRRGLEILVDRKRGTDLTGIKVHETRRLPESHKVDVDGLPTTSVARTFRDIGFQMSERAARHMAERIVADKLAQPAELAAVHLALARRGRDGTVFTRQLLNSFQSTDGHPASELEIRMRELLRDNDIAGFVTQFKPSWYIGADGIVDFADPGRKVIIEVDGRRWHSVQQQMDIDRRRDREAQRHGWVPLRFNWPEVVHEGELVIDHIRAMCLRQQRAA